MDLYLLSELAIETSLLRQLNPGPAKLFPCRLSTAIISNSCLLTVTFLYSRLFVFVKMEYVCLCNVLIAFCVLYVVHVSVHILLCLAS